MNISNATGMEFKSRIDKVQKILKNDRLDAVLVFSTE
jgi:hypothetical protein